MLTEPQREYLRAYVFTMRIIVVALAAGIALFAVIAVAISPARPAAQPAAGPLISYIAAAMAAVAIVLWAVVPGVVAGRMRQAIVDGSAPQALPLSANAAELGNVGPLAASYLTRLIIGDALLEGAAFFNLVAYLIEQQVFSLAVAGALLLIILAQFPSLSRLTDWVERELATTEQLQVLRRS